MLFEQPEEALRWYESQERVLTPAFLETIPWKRVADAPIRAELIPVIRYMRDVENFTAIYFDELQKTPTGKDPVIRAFMDRWSTEETVHGDLLHRFLEEAGVPTRATWSGEARAAIPRSYRFTSALSSLVANAFGKHFAAVHMTWGAINELSTLSGYERLWTLAKHPVLEYLLRGIAREEARHSMFYWSMARIALRGSSFRQALTRYIIKHFWSPVGQGAKPERETNDVIATLFRGEEGLALMEKRVNQRMEQLPGFAGLKRITERVAEISLAVSQGVPAKGRLT